jgi:hypothetical protein
MQKLRPDLIKDIAKTGTLTAQMPAGSYVTVGGQQYTNSAALNLNLASSGAGGLDTGAVAARTTYYIYGVVAGGALALTASTSSSAPTGFTASKLIGAFTTNDSAATINFMFAVGQDPGEPLIATAGAQTYAEPTIVPTIPAPNLIINGAMDFWQRGIGPLDTNINRTYSTVDRFIIGASGGSGGQIQSRSTTVPNTQFKYSVQQVENGDQNGNSLVAFQKIEAQAIRPYIGKQMTFSLWVQFSTVLPSGPALLVYTPVSGSEDSWNADPLADTIAVTQTITGLTLGVWSRVSVTFTVPAGASNGLMVAISTQPYNGQPTMRHTGWMLTPGYSVPDYFYRAAATVQQELAMCQRYYEKSYDIDTAPGTATSNGQIYTGCRANSTTNIDPGPWVQFKVPKRRVPVDADFTFFDQTGATGLAWNNGAQVANPTATVSEGVGSFAVHYTGSAGLTLNSSYIVRGHWTCSTEL